MINGKGKNIKYIKLKIHLKIVFRNQFAYCFVNSHVINFFRIVLHYFLK